MTPGAAFPKARRVRRRAEFLRVQGVARRVTTPSFTLLVAASPAACSPDAVRGDLPPARLGLITTRKIGNAVQRNRIKRLCRECFRKGTWLPPGFDLLVVARARAAELSLAEVEAEWRAVRGLLAQRAREALAEAAGTSHVPRSPARANDARPRPGVKSVKNP